MKEKRVLCDNKFKKAFLIFLHPFFLSGILYAFYFFVTTPKTNMEVRRLWAYETWIIFSFYGIFVYLFFIEYTFKQAREKFREFRLKFQSVMMINLILLILPWGLFLLLAPRNMIYFLGLETIYYWRILGIFSILSAAIYYLPFQFLQKKWSLYILKFGMIDNLIAGLLILILFLQRRIPLMVFMTMPILLYFSYFFREQSIVHKELINENNRVD